MCSASRGHLASANQKRFAAGILSILATASVLAVVVFPQLPEASAAVSPSTVGTTTNANGLGSASENHVCGANGYFWVFYYGGSSWGYQSSSNGQTWSAFTSFTSAVPGPAGGTDDMAFYCSSTTNTVYYAGGTQSQDAHFYYDTGSLGATGSITWNTESSVATQGYNVAYPSITLDSSGDVWVAVQTQNTGGGGPYYIEVFEFTTAWEPSTQMSFSSYLPIPQLVALPSGGMALLYGTNSIAIGLETYNGSWATGPFTAATNYNIQLSTAVSVGETIEFCASTGSNIYLLSYTYGTSSSWSSPATAFAAGIACSATTDGSSVLGLFYVASSSTIMYDQSNNGGSTFVGAQTVSNTETDVSSIGAGLAVSANPAKQVMAAWISGAGPTYDVRFANIATAPVVQESITITSANGGPVGTASISGCHASVSSISMDGEASTVGADPSCSLTITVPTDQTYSRYRFSSPTPTTAGMSSTFTFTTLGSGSGAQSVTVYYQYSVTASYSLATGCGSASAPSLTSSEVGSAYSTPLTTAATAYWLDAGASWSVTPTVTSGSTTCPTYTSTSGTVTGPTIISFNYQPSIQISVSTSVSSSVSTSVSTTVSSSVSSSVSTSVSQSVSSSVSTSVASSVSSYVSSSVSSSVSQSVSSSVSSSRSTTVTSTVGVVVPSASALVCNSYSLQPNQRIECTDVVYTADNGTAMGTVAWTSLGGTFANEQCTYANNYNFFQTMFGNNFWGELECQAQYTLTSTGVQTVTATYSGDPYHSSSVASTLIFAGNTQSSKVTETAVTCSSQYLSSGQSTNCQATVTAASGIAPTGSVTWSASDHGTFSSTYCYSYSFGNELQCTAKYTPASTGTDTVTASYGGDSSHSSSSGSFTIFVWNPPNGYFETALALSGGSLAAAGLGLVVVRRRKQTPTTQALT